MTGFQLLPPLSPDDRRRLRDSIAERGVEVPIVVDEAGAVLDGHHRAAIAAELGLPCPRVVREGLAEHEKRLLAVELNLARRQLTDAQKALLGRQIEPDVAARSAERRKATQNNDAGRELSRGGHLSTSAPRVGNASTSPTDPGKTRDEVASAVGLGTGRTYERAKRTIADVERFAPDLMPRVEAGEVDLNTARKELRRRVPDSPLAREFYAAADDAIAGADPASLAALQAELAEATLLPATATRVATAVSLLSRAHLEMRGLRPEVLRQLVEGDADERQRVDRALDLLAAMAAICRAAAGKRGDLRRIV